MIPSTGGNSPPDIPPDPFASLPPEPALNRRSSSRNRAVNKDNLSPRISSGSQLQPIKVVQKPARPEKGRQPLVNLSVNDLVHDQSQFTLITKPEIPLKKGEICNSPIPSDKTVDGNSPIIAKLIPTVQETIGGGAETNHALHLNSDRQNQGVNFTKRSSNSCNERKIKSGCNCDSWICMCLQTLLTKLHIFCWTYYPNENTSDKAGHLNREGTGKDCNRIMDKTCRCQTSRAVFQWFFQALAAALYLRRKKNKDFDQQIHHTVILHLWDSIFISKRRRRHPGTCLHLWDQIVFGSQLGRTKTHVNAHHFCYHGCVYGIASFYFVLLYAYGPFDTFGRVVKWLKYLIIVLATNHHATMLKRSRRGILSTSSKLSHTNPWRWFSVSNVKKHCWISYFWSPKHVLGDEWGYAP